MIDKTTKIIVLIMLTLLLIFNFEGNFFIGKERTKKTYPRFDAFEAYSEYLVFSKVFQDKYERKDSNYGLCIVEKEEKRVSNINEYIGGIQKQEDVQIEEYRSQVGLQGYIFSFLYNKLHISFGVIRLLCCTLLAIIIVAICYTLCNKYNKLMGAVFYITFLLSPWVVAMARNLYWVEFTFFLPMLLGLILSVNYKRKKILVLSIFLAILFKCLCGYEYISTIMLGTIAFFIVDFFTAKDKEKKKEIFKTTVIVGIACIMAFIVAICIHGRIKGNGNIIEGIKIIYEDDVLRRTVLASEASDKGEVEESYKESIEASIGETVRKYFVWESDIILGIEGKYFMLFFMSSLAITIYNVLKQNKNCYRDLAMFCIFLITTLSWIVLGKAHSYIHWFINFILWYFGFIQICLYIIIKFICKKTYEFGQEIEKGEKSI